MCRIVGAGLTVLAPVSALAQARTAAQTAAGPGAPPSTWRFQVDVGGTWYENTYPGCRVDIANHFYCYSFEPNHDWSEFYSQQGELHEYFDRCADKYGVRRRIRFNTEVVAARFDAFFHLIGIVECSQENDWCFVTDQQPGPAAGFDSIQLGHHDVEQHQFRLNPVEQAKRFQAVGGGHDIEAVGAEEIRVQTAQLRVVLCKDNCFCAHRVWFAVTPGREYSIMSRIWLTKSYGNKNFRIATYASWTMM